MFLLPHTTFAQGFVQCSGPDCDFCSLVDTINAVLAFIIQIAIIGCIIIIAWAGLKMVVSRGNPGAWKEAKEFMMNVLIGIVIIFMAFTIIDLLLKVTVGGDFGVWNEIGREDCGGQAAHCL